MSIVSSYFQKFPHISSNKVYNSSHTFFGKVNDSSQTLPFTKPRRKEWKKTLNQIIILRNNCKQPWKIYDLSFYSLKLNIYMFPTIRFWNPSPLLKGIILACWAFTIPVKLYPKQLYKDAWIPNILNKNPKLIPTLSY